MRCWRPPGSVSTNFFAGVRAPLSDSTLPLPSDVSLAGWPLIHTWPSRMAMRSPGRPITRFTQVWVRSPGQRNTTTSPRRGMLAKMRWLVGRSMKLGSEAVP